VAVLLATTVAAASFQGAWLPRTYRALQRVSGLAWLGEADRHRQPVAHDEKQAPAASPERQDLTGPSPAPQEAPPATLEPAPSSAAVASIRVSAAGTKRRSSRDARAQENGSPPRPGEASRGEGAGLVLTAIQTLRRDHDGARAGALLEEYLREHPTGALREEAMALAVEAASARGDRREAQSLALLYQRTFPNGRFRRSRPLAP
jgi:hypothetical protein